MKCEIGMIYSMHGKAAHNSYTVLVRKPEGKRPQEGHGRITLKYVLRKQDGRVLAGYH
jgi:hypothetical protein